MAAPTCTDAEFIATWNRHSGYVPGIQAELRLTPRAILGRRVSIESRHGMVLKAGKFRPDVAKNREHVDKIGHRITLNVKDGVVVIFGDAHYWPGEKPIAHQALLRFIKQHKPVAVICNGDAFDGARISRHPPTGWANMPEVADELQYCQQMLSEIEEAAPPKCKLIWNFGNHDTRYSARLAQMAPDYVRIHGTDLPDHFPAWNFAWSTQINESIMVKHRWHNGVHATWNNALKSGVTIFTNHIHRLCVTPITDYNGRRYGVDCGTLSDFGPDVPKFTYGEDNPYNWGSGFAVATFKRGRLLPPELVIVQDKIAYFRGQPV
jgi:hypothetical protein